MKKIFKRGQYLLFSLVLFLTGCTETYVPEPLENMFRFWFIEMEQLGIAGNEIFYIYGRLFFFIMVYAIMYFGAKKVFGKEDNRVSSIVSFVLAIAGTIMIPKELIGFLYQEYSAVVGILLGLLPFFVGLWITKTKFDNNSTMSKVFKNIIYILMGIVMLSLGGFVTSNGDQSVLYSEFAGWIALGGALSLIFGIIGMIGSIGGGGNGGEDTTVTPDRTREAATPTTEAERATEAEDEKEEEVSIKQEIIRIKDLYQKIMQQRDILKEFKTKGSIQDSEVEPLKNEYDTKINECIQEAEQLIELDERIKKYANKLYNWFVRKYKKSTSRIARQNMDAVRKIKYEYRNSNKMEKLTDTIIKKLRKTINLPIMITNKADLNAMSGTNEISILNSALNNIKKEYNELVKMLKANREVINEL